MDEIYLYDTTLRDGTQREGISLSVDDKLKIAQRLDEFGVQPNAWMNLVCITLKGVGQGRIQKMRNFLSAPRNLCSSMPSWLPLALR